MAVPTPGGRPYVCDGGIETDLIYHRGADLPEFAAFTLVDDDHGRDLLTGYYGDYATIARDRGVGLVLASPTWRANPDWATKVGYDLDALDRANCDSVALMAQIRRTLAADIDDVVISGVVGPRGDGYVAGQQTSVEEAAAYHGIQIDSLAAGGADLIEAITMTTVAEAAGVARAANRAGLPVGIMFTVETDGALPDGTALGNAIEAVDAASEVAYFGINCAHPDHITPALTGGSWAERIAEIKPNASTKSHAELDAAEDLDEGDIAALATAVRDLRPKLPNLSILGGCCGTDHRHVAAVWDL